MIAAQALAWRPVSASQRMDTTLLFSTVALVLVGLVAITSASVEYAELHYGDPFYHSRRHLIYLLLAAAVGLCAYRVPSKFWQQTDWLWLILAMLGLIMVLIPGIGREVNGSQRWLSLGPLTLQVSEFTKIAVIVYLGGYLVRREREVRSEWQGFIKPMAVLFAVTLLLLLEPDFGATVVTVATAFGMLFLAGVRLAHFLFVVLGSVLALLILVWSEPYRMARLTSYTDPWADQFNSGYQLTQSLIAYGRGEWLGVGLGNSVQKLFYLPEAHTDFVFSIWAEETGFVGAVVVIAVFVLLVYRILWVGARAVRSGDSFAGHFCHGVALLLAGQAFINIGVSSGLLPTKGLTLPFISYGGSSVIACCAMVGMVLRIDWELRQPRRRSVGVKRGKR